jgi:hypothetical protein
VGALRHITAVVTSLITPAPPPPVASLNELSLLVPWLVFPLAFGVVCLGCGALVARLARLEAGVELLLPLGYAAVVVAAGFVVWLPGTASLALPVIVGLAAAGCAASWPPRRPGRRAAAALMAAGAVFVAYGLPVLASGEATFAGYISLDDTATWLGLADRTLEEGRSVGGLAPSSYEAAVATYLGAGYPVGAFLPFGIGAQLVGQDVAWVFQPSIAFVAALLALALYALARPLVRSVWTAAFIAFVAAQPALLYAYAQWSGVKEVSAACLVASCCALAAGKSAPGLRGALPVATVAAALAGVLSLGGLVWLGAAAALGAWLAWTKRRRARAAGVALLTLALALPLIETTRAFLRTGEGTIRSADEFGNLPRPLDLFQVAGIWPTTDFRTDPDVRWLTLGLVGLVACLAGAGAVYVVRHGSWAAAAYIATSVGAAVVLVAAGSPWVDGKALATASPAVIFAALLGCAWLLVRAGTVPAVAAAIVVAVGVLWSNGLAYHGVTLAPHDQLAELEEIGDRFAGQGPALMTEYQPYGVRHFLRRLDPEGASELRRRLVSKVDGSLPQKGETPDLDQLALPGVLVYRTLVLRRSPVASRPPAPYDLRWRGRWYEVWQRPAAGRSVASHLPLGDTGNPGATAPCRDVLGVAAGAGEVATVVRRNPVAVLAARSSGVEEAFLLSGPGRYSLWLAGSRRAPADVYVDGSRIRRVPSHFDRAAEYSELGRVILARGLHTIRVRFDSRPLEPGTGGPQYGFGPLVLAPLDSRRAVTTVEPSAARQLCGRTLDWVEGLR